MNAKQRMLVTCIALGLGVSSVYAEETHHPGTDATSGTAETTQSVQQSAPADSADTGMGMMGQGMVSNQGGMGMGRGGPMSMMHGGKGGGMGMMHGGGEMHAKHRNLLGRLDLLEARMAKIETLLERLLMR